MSIIGAFIMPHPPVIIPEVGGGREREVAATSASMYEVSRRIAELRPDTVILTSPHSVMYSDWFHVSPGAGASGSFKRFGAGGVKITASYDEDFIRELESSALTAGIAAGTLGERERELDHGTLVPLYFLQKYLSDYKLVRIGLSGLPYADHYRLGALLRDCAVKRGRRTVFLASGDLSHKVAADGPYGYAEEGVIFDREVTQAMAAGDFSRFLSFSPELTEKAAECGLRSFIIMAGALDGISVKPELLSYEGTFGVGYGVAAFEPGERNENRRFLDAHLKAERERLSRVKQSEDEYVKLARYSLERYVRTGKRAPMPEEGLPPELTDNRAGVFVSLKKHGSLRGCIGTIGPVTDSVAEEILRNAVSAGAEDRRFDPVHADELDELVYSVDVLSPPEPIESESELDVQRYGVIVSSGRKRGLLLPNLEGVDTVREQVDIAKRKAGIRQGEKAALERFEVVRHR